VPLENEDHAFFRNKAEKIMPAPPTMKRHGNQIV
jgi:hypothetical protein